MTQRILRDLELPMESRVPGNTTPGNIDYLSFDDTLNDAFNEDVRSLPGSAINREGPMIAIEQLFEALEERQNPDQRRQVEPIKFADRRKTIRRASDLKR